MPYTREDAKREVGNSKDWLVGLEASIKKWEQRVRGDVESYGRNKDCGLCFVADNRKLHCRDCPAYPFCCGISGQDGKEVLQALKNLRKELKKDCSKICANFKPKNESPFPEGLKTEDLKVGMVVRKGNVTGSIYTILEHPGEKSVRVLGVREGHKPTETWLSLPDNGCQPYQNGVWDLCSWLRKVK